MNVKPSYRVKDEYIDQWYGSESTDAIEAQQEKGFTFEEVKRLASEWGCSVDDLMEQLEEI